MAQQPKILIFGGSERQWQSSSDALQVCWLPVRVKSLPDALEHLNEADVRGILVLEPNIDALKVSSLLPQAAGILSQLPDGVALLDPQLRISWSNRRFDQLAGSGGWTWGRTFFEAFGTTESANRDFSPFQTALSQNQPGKGMLKLGEKTYLEVQVAPVQSESEPNGRLLLVTVRDISIEILQQQKLNAIYHAGLELGELAPSDLQHMSVQDRIELLKSRIIHYTKDLLEFETVEIRLLDRNTKRLEPLLAVGMQPEAENRVLFASAEGNGVTGFVAATGRSYLCEDTAADPLYLPGAYQARSSLTVPLMLFDDTVGTFNVESTHAGAFNEQDLQFLELFCREIAVALNTLELLVAEKMTTATESTEMMLREVAGPVDEVINDAAWILERYIGHDQQVTDRLQQILQHTRDIKQLIHKVGETMTPKVANSPLPPRPQRPKLRAKRVLVADNDETVRRAAHELLGRFGCQVETAHNGEEALLMVRRFPYDVVLADIRLPDMTGYECFCQVHACRSNIAVILMTGFGYDPGHSIVKARQRGLKAVLYKPFRVDQLLDEVEKAVSQPVVFQPLDGSSPESSSGASGSAATGSLPPLAGASTPITLPLLVSSSSGSPAALPVAPASNPSGPQTGIATNFDANPIAPSGQSASPPVVPIANPVPAGPVPASPGASEPLAAEQAAPGQIAPGQAAAEQSTADKSVAARESVDQSRPVRSGGPVGMSLGASVKNLQDRAGSIVPPSDRPRSNDLTVPSAPS